MNRIFRCFALPTLWLLAAPVQAGDALRLRVNDATAVPGGIGAVVVRTYASRPIRQGQICFVSRPLLRAGTSGAGPFEALVGATVFSVADDAVEEAELLPDAGGQMTMVSFDSASASINAADGPLLVLYYRLRADLLPGESYTLDIDPDNTFLSGPDGAPVAAESRDGRLHIRAPGSTVEVGAGAEEPEGKRVALSLQTEEFLSISSGQFALRYPPGLIREGAKAVIERRYGNARWHLSQPRGLVVVSFDSPDASLGRVPGDLVTVVMRLYDDIDPGQDRRVWLDPAYTFLFDEHGTTVPLSYDDDVIPFPERLPIKNAIRPRNTAVPRKK